MRQAGKFPTDQGPVVRKPISANPGLEVRREFYIS